MIRADYFQNARRFCQLMSFIVFLILLLSISVPAFGAMVLYTYSQDVSPKYMLVGKEFSGLCHDILVELNKELQSQGVEIRYKAKDLKSIEEIRKALENNEIQIFIGHGHSVEVEKKINFVKLPLYASKQMFIVEANTKDKIFEKAVVKIGAIAGTIPSQNIPQISRKQEVVFYKNLDELYKALEKKEIDAAYAIGLTLGYLVNQAKGKYVPLNLTSGKFYYYIVLSKNVSQQIVLKIENALRNLHSKGVIESLIKKYNLQQYVLPGNVVEILLVDWKPYEWYDTKKGDLVGIDIDVVKSVFQKIGCKPVFLTFPWQRCLEYMKVQAYDATMSVSFTQERAEFLIYTSEPLSSGKAVLFKLKSSNINIQTLESIPKDTRCGYCDGYGYPEWFWKADFKKISLTTDEVGFRLLKDGKIDIFISNLLVGKYLAKQLNMEVYWSPAYGGVQYYYIAFSKNYRGNVLADIFSQELRRFKKTKEYLEILKRYAISYDELWK